MTEVCRLSPELRAYWSQLTWRDWDLQSSESLISAGRYDRWRVVSIWSLRSPNFFFFSAIKRKARLSSKYAPRYCCATLLTFKEQYPVTAHVPEDARRAREPWKICLHRAWPSSILHQNVSQSQINNILFPFSCAGIQMKIGSLRTDSKK